MVLLLSTTSAALAQAEPKLPLHGWVRADLDLAPAGARGWVGLAVPISHNTAVAIEVSGSDVAVGLDAGPTLEIGALYLAPAAGFEYGWVGVPGVALQLQAAFEAPPIPVYFESWVRGVVRSPFGGADDLLHRTLLLATVRRWLALGPEHDAIVGVAASARWGLRVNLGLGHHVVVGVFAGYELRSEARDRAAFSPNWLAGRTTLNVTW